MCQSLNLGEEKAFCVSQYQSDMPALVNSASESPSSGWAEPWHSALSLYLTSSLSIHLISHEHTNPLHSHAICVIRSNGVTAESQWAQRRFNKNLSMRISPFFFCVFFFFSFLLHLRQWPIMPCCTFIFLCCSQDTQAHIFLFFCRKKENLSRSHWCFSELAVHVRAKSTAT